MSGHSKWSTIKREILNDNDGYIDGEGGPEGEPPDDKCLALNEPREGNNMSLSSSASVSPDGGLLILGNFWLFFPEGALTQRSKIILERIPSLSPDTLSYPDIYNLSPNDVTPQKPLVMMLRMNPTDPNVPQKPWLFTEVDGGENVPLEGVGHLEFGETSFTMGAISHFSKKGGTNAEDFERRWNSRPVSGDCFSSYLQGPCPDDAALCHAGLAGNVPCASCLIKSPREYCCICPSDFPQNDLPCEDDAGNPIELFPECRRFEYPISSDSCEQFLNRSPKGSDGHPKPGRTGWYIEPTWRRIATGVEPSGRQFCGTPTIQDVRVAVEIKTHYPRWSGASACQTEWDRFMDKLRQHEKGHADIAKSEGVRLKRNIESQTWPRICDSSREKLNQIIEAQVDRDTGKIFQRFKEGHQSLQDTYDRQTSDGETQGAVLDCGVCP